MPFALGLVLAFAQYRRGGAPRGESIKSDAADEARNPLELSAAAVFAVLFVVISIVSSWVKEHFGTVGIDVLAAVVGVTDIDPFVLSLAQGVAAPLPVEAAASAVLIATASNNLLKAGYAAAFMGLRARVCTQIEDSQKRVDVIQTSNWLGGLDGIGTLLAIGCGVVEDRTADAARATWCASS